ncbi:hypothetical protein SAMN05216386_2653 [Nitrosospira briensis]|uniref:Uncharacterized protein n=1 Tax=Nitrosospira briensis TaxID=35799 RepID=A0A1I5EGW5_9PROT|nr:hypothetical protein SAMN05216386_2653 [Nitrosospira briensis]
MLRFPSRASLQRPYVSRETPLRQLERVPHAKQGAYPNRRAFSTRHQPSARIHPGISFRRDPDPALSPVLLANII